MARSGPTVQHRLSRPPVGWARRQNRATRRRVREAETPDAVTRMAVAGIGTRRVGRELHHAERHRGAGEIVDLADEAGRDSRADHRIDMGERIAHQFGIALRRDGGRCGAERKTEQGQQDAGDETAGRAHSGSPECINARPPLRYGTRRRPRTRAGPDAVAVLRPRCSGPHVASEVAPCSSRVA